MVTLNKPSAGATDWTTLINDNWTSLENSVPSAATQAEQEAGSSTTVYTSPGRQQYHSSAAKGWINFNGTGTIAIRSSYNVISITDNNVGQYTVTWDVDFSSVNYAVAGFVNGPGAATWGICEDSDNPAHLVGSIRIWTFQTNTNGLTDCGIVCLVAFGDQ